MVAVTVRAAGLNQAGVGNGDIETFGGGVGGSATNAQDNFIYGSGLNDFKIANLPEVGATVNVVILQLQAIPANAIYRKLAPANGWRDFVENGTDTIASAPGLVGECPPPGSPAYTQGLTPGDLCVQLTLTDGGPKRRGYQPQRAHQRIRAGSA